MSYAHLRHVSAKLSPVAQMVLRTTSEEVLDSLAPPERAVGVASMEFQKYVVRHRHHITHLSLLIDDERYEGMIHVIPSLERLKSLDIRTSLGEIHTWLFGDEVCDRLETLSLVGSVVTVDHGKTFRNLKRLILVSGSFLNIDFHVGSFSKLEYVHLECHSLECSVAELPQSILMLRIAVPNCPPQVFTGVCCLNNIRHLSLDCCRLQYLPEALGHLKTLETLSVRGNYLTIFNDRGERDGEALPIHNMQNLRCLDISDNICMSLSEENVVFPESLQYLDVRSITSTYYEPGFFDSMVTPNLTCLYTTHLPSRRVIVERMQNLRKIVYAPPQRVFTAVERMIHLLNPDFPSAWPTPLLYGQHLPTTLEGLELFIEGLTMPFEDLVRYKDL